MSNSFDRAQANYERRRLITPEDEDDEAERKWHHEKFLEDRADEMYDREKDERAMEKPQ